MGVFGCINTNILVDDAVEYLLERVEVPVLHSNKIIQLTTSPFIRAQLQQKNETLN